jgi:putative PIN family toxin of toxin-antitoxin system
VGAAQVTRRVVLDTNAVVSALLFETGRLARLRHPCMAGDYSPLVTPSPAAELLRVLSYSKFRLTGDEIETLLADLLPYAETVEVPRRTSKWPGLTDSDDRIFLDLAVAGKAAFLVTGDRALLAADPPDRCRIVTPAEFLAILKG